MELEVLLFNNDGMSSEACANLFTIVNKSAPMNIKRIEFYNNMSGDAGAISIASLLECLPYLEVFRWSTTRTNEEGAFAICQALAHCPAIRRLEIKDNYFGENCGELLATAIGNMKNLEHLILSDISKLSGSCIL